MMDKIDVINNSNIMLKEFQNEEKINEKSMILRMY